MLSTNVAMTETASLIDGQLDDLLCARSETDLAKHCAIATTDNELDGRAHLI